MRIPFKVAFMAALFLMSIPAAALAGMVEVRPTTFTITPDQRTAVLSVTNPDQQSVAYQIRAYRWKQAGAVQSLEPTSDLIASPPIIQLAARGTQTVRIGLRSKALPENEDTYRLILEEIPVEGTSKPAGLNVMLRLSLPVFVRQQKEPPSPRLTATLQYEDGRTQVAIVNNGQYTTRITRATLNVPDRNGPALGDLVYILPGGWNIYKFSLPSNFSSMQSMPLTLQTSDGDIDLQASLAPAPIQPAVKNVEAPSDATSPAPR